MNNNCSLAGYNYAWGTQHHSQAPLPSRGSFRGGAGGHSPPLIKSRPPLEIASLQSASHVHRASPPLFFINTHFALPWINFYVKACLLHINTDWCFTTCTTILIIMDGTRPWLLVLVRYNSVFVPLCSPNTCKDIFNPNVTAFHYHLLRYTDMHIKGAAYMSRGGVYMRIRNEPELVRNHLSRSFLWNPFNPDQHCNADAIEPVRSGSVV